jgi:hypothetical protein
MSVVAFGSPDEQDVVEASVVQIIE